MRGLQTTFLGLWACLVLGGCQTHLKTELGAGQIQRYEEAYPIYAELCAASQFRKRPAYPPSIEGGGFGGHEVLYLNGVCRAKDAGYSVIKMCAPGDKADGVGLSVNAHYKNANWVATEGQRFFFDGILEKGAPLTKAAYDATVARAEAMNIYDGIVFHDETLQDIPAGTSLRDYMYQVSLGTDYALSYARDRYCARIPLDAAQMSRVVDYLNGVNAPYRSGAKIFNWSVLRDNCSHLIHNALAAAGVWAHWDTGRSLIPSAFDFPTPKNEFVKLARKTNDGPLDVETLFKDDVAREALMKDDFIATGPGGLVELGRAVQQNEIYDPNVKLIFFSDPLLGPYERRYRRIQDDPRYSEMDANNRYFATLYHHILDERQPLSAHLQRHPGWSPDAKDRFTAFYVRYYDYVTRQSATLELRLKAGAH